MTTFSGVKWARFLGIAELIEITCGTTGVPTPGKVRARGFRIGQALDQPEGGDPTFRFLDARFSCDYK
jgi:hypothetical protein